MSREPYFQGHSSKQLNPRGRNGASGAAAGRFSVGLPDLVARTDRSSSPGCPEGARRRTPSTTRSLLPMDAPPLRVAPLHGGATRNLHERGAGTEHAAPAWRPLVAAAVAVTAGARGAAVAAEAEGVGPGAAVASVVTIAITMPHERRRHDADADQHEPAVVVTTVLGEAMADEATAASSAVPLVGVVDGERLARARRRRVVRIARVGGVPVVGSRRRERHARRVRHG